MLLLLSAPTSATLTMRCLLVTVATSSFTTPLPPLFFCYCYICFMYCSYGFDYFLTVVYTFSYMYIM